MQLQSFRRQPQKLIHFRPQTVPVHNPPVLRNIHAPHLQSRIVVKLLVNHQHFSIADHFVQRNTHPPRHSLCFLCSLHFKLQRLYLFIPLLYDLFRNRISQFYILFVNFFHCSSDPSILLFQWVDRRQIDLFLHFHSFH